MGSASLCTHGRLGCRRESGIADGGDAPLPFFPLRLVVMPRAFFGGMEKDSVSRAMMLSCLLPVLALCALHCTVLHKSQGWGEQQCCFEPFVLALSPVQCART